MLLPYKQNPCCKNQAYWRMVSLVRSAWRPRHASCQYYAQSRRGRRDKRGFPAWHQQFTPHSNHNLFSRIPTIYPVRRPQFIQQGVIFSLRMASSPCVLSILLSVSAGTPRQARFPGMAPRIYSAKRPYFASHGVLAMRLVNITLSLGGDAETSEVSRTAPKIYSKKRPYFASHGVLAMRFAKKSPSLGGDAETSEVTRHGTHKLFSKASLFRFAWRPRHALCQKITQSRRGRRDKPGFPSWHPQFIQKSVLISLRMASSPCVSSKSEASRHGKQTS